MYLRESFRTATIANGQTTSDAIPVRGRVVAGLRTPAALTGVTITFTASETFDGTYAPVYDTEGNQVSVTVTTSRFYGLSGSDADAVAAAGFLKLVSGSAEGAAREIVVSLK